MSGTASGFCYDCNATVSLLSQQDGDETLYKCEQCGSEFVEVRSTEPQPTSTPAPQTDQSELPELEDTPTQSTNAGEAISRAVGGLLGGIMRGVRQYAGSEEEDEEMENVEAVLNPLVGLLGNFIGNTVNQFAQGFSSGTTRRRRNNSGRRTARPRRSTNTPLTAAAAADEQALSGISISETSDSEDVLHANADADTASTTTPAQTPLEPSIHTGAASTGMFRSTNRVHLPPHAPPPPVRPVAPATISSEASAGTNAETTSQGVTGDAPAVVSDGDNEMNDGEAPAQPGADSTAPQSQATDSTNPNVSYTPAAGISLNSRPNVLLQHVLHRASAALQQPGPTVSVVSSSSSTGSGTAGTTRRDGAQTIRNNISGIFGNVIPGIMNVFNELIPNIITQELAGFVDGEAGLSESDFSELEVVQIPEGVLELCARDKLYTLPRATAWQRYVAEASRRHVSAESTDAANQVTDVTAVSKDAEGAGDGDASLDASLLVPTAPSPSALATVEDDDEEMLSAIPTMATVQETSSHVEVIETCTSSSSSSSSSSSATVTTASCTEEHTQTTIQPQPGDDEPQVPVCAVCLSAYQPLDTIARLKCGHDYHVDCAKEWLKRRNTCPVCRAPVKETTGRRQPSANRVRPNIININLAGNAAGHGPQVVAGGDAAHTVRFASPLDDGLYHPQVDIRTQQAQEQQQQQQQQANATSPPLSGSSISSIPGSSSAIAATVQQPGVQMRVHLRMQPPAAPAQPAQSQGQQQTEGTTTPSDAAGEQQHPPAPQATAPAGPAAPTPTAPTSAQSFSVSVQHVPLAALPQNQPATQDVPSSIPSTQQTQTQQAQQQTIRISFGSPAGVQNAGTGHSINVVHANASEPRPSYDHPIGPARSPTSNPVASTPQPQNAQSPSQNVHIASPSVNVAGPTIRISHGPNATSQTIQIIHNAPAQTTPSATPYANAATPNIPVSGPTIRIRTGPNGVQTAGVGGGIQIAHGTGQTIRINFGPNGVIQSTSGPQNNTTSSSSTNGGPSSEGSNNTSQ